MQINLAEPNPFTRCYFDEDDHGEGWVDVRTLNIAKLNEIEKKTVIEKKRLKRGQVLTERKVNQKLKDTMTWGYCIGEWAVVVDEKAQPIPNTVENKVFLMTNSPSFSTFVVDQLEKLGDIEIEEAEAEEKN